MAKETENNNQRKNMAKKEIIKEIEETERKLKELREKASEPENVEPKEGDVVILEGDHVYSIWGDDACLFIGRNSALVTPHREVKRRLGTFSEVFVERSEVDKEYVPREPVKELVDDYGDSLLNMESPSDAPTHEAWQGNYERVKELISRMGF